MKRVEKVDSPIGDENHVTNFLYKWHKLVEKVDSPIGDENRYSTQSSIISFGW